MGKGSNVQKKVQAQTRNAKDRGKTEEGMFSLAMYCSKAKEKPPSHTHSRRVRFDSDSSRVLIYLDFILSYPDENEKNGRLREKNRSKCC